MRGGGGTIHLKATTAATNTALPPKPGRSVPAVATEDSPDGHAPTAQLKLAVNTGQAHGEMARRGHTGGVWEPDLMEINVLRETWPSARAIGPRIRCVWDASARVHGQNQV